MIKNLIQKKNHRKCNKKNILKKIVTSNKYSKNKSIFSKFVKTILNEIYHQSNNNNKIFDSSFANFSYQKLYF